MDIDVELEKIIEKYDLDKCDPAYRQKKKAQTIIKNIIDSFTGKIAVIATFESDINRFQFLLKDHQADYYYCYKNDIVASDSNYDLTYNMSALEDVCFEKYDYIWLVSLEGSVFVKRWLRKYNVNYHFLYDDLEMNGCYCIGDWYSLRRDPELEWWTHRCWYKPKREWLVADTVELISDYKYTCKGPQKIHKLKKLFFRSIVHRDFCLAERCMKLMPDENFNEHLAWKDIQNLFAQIITLLAYRKKHIALIWTDDIAYADIGNCKFLDNLKSKTLFFDNMHTICANTNPTLKTIFCGKLPVDDNTYDIKKITPDNSILWNILRDKGYDLCIIGGCQNWSAIPMKIRSSQYHASYGATSELLWDLWRNMILKEKPTFFMLHSLLETHPPYLSLEIGDEYITDTNKRRNKSSIYLSKQYEFYMSKYPDSQIRIYMTDHGSLSFKTMHHTFFAVEGLRNVPQHIRRMCSYVDFYKILKQIIDNSYINTNYIGHDFVYIQNLDYYSSFDTAILMKNKISLHPYLFGYHGLITNDDIYIHFTDGREWFVRRDDAQAPEPNLFGSYIYDESKVEWYREIVRQQEQNVPDFSKKLKYSKYIHKVFENAKKKNYRKRDIINQIVSQYPDRSIYIRLGGSYGRQIYGILSKENQRKIGGVVDLSQDCMCSKYGLPVYSSVEELPDTAKIILPSNENFIDRAEKECAACSHNLQVLNLHEKLKEYGIYTKDCVALFQPSPEDYEVDFPFDEIQY